MTLRRPLINKLTNPCYRVLCPGHGASAAQSAFVMNSGPLPGSDDTEAQRRRYALCPSSPYPPPPPREAAHALQQSKIERSEWVVVAAASAVRVR